MKTLSSLLGLVLATSALAAPETPADKPAAKPEAPKKEETNAVTSVPDSTKKPVVTEHTITLGGKPFVYQAETGMLPLLKEDGTPRASVFYVAYTKKNPGDVATRPVLFCFNGGPGASAVWLHLGGLGPRRAKVNDDGTLPAPPFKIVDNEYSTLAVADLVFIDPVATGFSRAAKDEKEEQFFGQESDIKTVADFIRLYTTRNERWRSPKYLCGESYGVFRAAGLANELQDTHGMFLNGLILMSGIIDFGSILSGPLNDLPYLTFLPSFTATAQFHGKLPLDLQTNLPLALSEARAFASGEYASALLQGASLEPARRADIVRKLSRFTGLSTNLIDENDLRIDGATFQKRLLAADGLICGRFDGRITGRDGDRARPYPGFDPSFAAALGPMSAAMNAYVREELKFENDLPYKVLARVQPWNYDQNRYASTSAQLASAMSENPHLRVLVLIGLRDLACPGDAMRYSLDHLPIARELRGNISYAEYESGHMMYLNLPDLKKLHQDLESFLK